MKKGEMIAVRPEEIIEARFTLSKRQNDILDMVFTQIQDDDNLKYTLELSKFLKLYKTDKRDLYRDLKVAVESLEGKGFRIFDKKTGVKRDFFVWFSRITYLDNEGIIQVNIDKDLKQIFLEMKKRIYYKIEYPLNFKCIYSKRLYYYLKSFEDTGWRIDKLEDLQVKLQCPESMMKYAEFRRNVLEKAYDELKSSDIYFSYEPKKVGRKVVSIKFSVFKNSSETTITTTTTKPKNKKPSIMPESKNAGFYDDAAEELEKYS